MARGDYPLIADDPGFQFYLDILDALAHSPLADIPQMLLTEEQILRACAGLPVTPTDAQGKAARAAGVPKTFSATMAATTMAATT